MISQDKTLSSFVHKLQRILRLRALAGVSLLFLTTCVIQAYGAQEAASKADAEKRVITIQEGISIVLRDSRLIRIALSDEDIAVQDSLIARSALLPHLSATAAQTFNQYQPAMKFGSQSVNTSDRNPFSTEVSVYQTLFDFGKSISNFKASEELIQARRANIEGVKRIATLEFIIAYFNLLETEKMIIVSEKEIESLSSYLKDIEHLCEQGAAIKNDLLPAKVRLSDSKRKRITACNEREAGTAQLNNILAFPLTAKIAAQDVETQAPHFPELEDAWKTACNLRPEIAFFENQIRASILSEKAKSVENLPTFFVNGGFSYSKNEFMVHEDNMFAMVGLRANLYDGGASNAELLKERFRQQQLKEQKGKLIEDIKFEIEGSYLGLKNAYEKLLVTKDSLEQAEENVRVYRLKYNTGIATSTEVLEAITLQTKAQTNYYSDDYELKRNYAKFMYSMGIDMASIYEEIKVKQNEAEEN